MTSVEDAPHSEPKQPVLDPSDASPPDQPPTQQQPGPDPAPQPTTTTTTTATTTNATPKPSASTDIPAGEKPVVDEKDKGSLSTSAGTRTHSALKGNKSSSEAALSASDATTTSPVKHEKPPKSQTKQSFLNKLVRVFIPCVTPSSRAHDIELPGDPQPTSTTPALKEKHASIGTVGGASSPAQNGRTPEPAQSSHQTSDPSTSSTVVSQQPVPRSDTLPQPSKDATPVDLAAPNDLTVTSTPSKTLLPVAETEGVTSGAVQPPGSKGDDVVHTRTHSQDSGDESDATTTFTEEDDMDEMNVIDDLEDEEERLIMNGGVGIPIGPVSDPVYPRIFTPYRATQDGVPRPLLPPLAPQHAGRKCLVLDLDETLLHSSFKVWLHLLPITKETHPLQSIQHADYVVPVEIEYHWHNVYVIKRPGVDNFLKKMGELYEIVVFTASLSKVLSFHVGPRPLVRC